jgi:hypothetical protein
MRPRLRFGGGVSASPGAVRTETSSWVWVGLVGGTVPSQVCRAVPAAAGVEDTACACPVFREGNVPGGQRAGSATGCPPVGWSGERSPGLPGCGDGPVFTPGVTSRSMFRRRLGAARGRTGPRSVRHRRGGADPAARADPAACADPEVLAGGSDAFPTPLGRPTPRVSGRFPIGRGTARSGQPAAAGGAEGVRPRGRRRSRRPRGARRGGFAMSRECAAGR